MAGRYSGRGRGLEAAPTVDPNPWTRPVTSAALLLIAFFSSGNFNDGIIPDSENSNFQQYIVIALWMAIAAVSYFRRQVLRIDPAAGLFVSLAPYALAVVSVGWSAVPAASVPKAAALAIVVFSAFRLVKTMPLDAIVKAVIHGLFALCALSIFLALFVPGVGLVTDYQHAGQWHGLFASKQTLGICGALLLFFASYRLMLTPGLAYYWLAVAAAVACVAGSGSRGGGALAAAAVVGLYLASVSTRVSRILAYGPFLMCLTGCVLIAYFILTGYKFIAVFDTEIDLTQRAIIWQYALGYFKNAPVLGYGLNGFWTLKEVKDLFIERNTWFLDNYHDGYIAIVMETGIVGLSLFAAGYFLYARRISADIFRSGALDRGVTLTLVYTCLIFLIDFTETYFLRSTNIASTLLTISLFVGFAQSGAFAPSAEGEAAGALEAQPRGVRHGRGPAPRFGAS